jgi:hypothetical protein
VLKFNWTSSIYSCRALSRCDLDADDPIAVACLAIRANKVVRLEGGHLVLPSGGWPGATSAHLFVRSFHAPLFHDILNGCRAARSNLDHELRTARFLLTGQPGTGKSVLLWYFIYRILTEQQHRTVVFVDGPKKRVMLFQPDGRTFLFPFDKLHDLRDLSILADPVVFCDSYLPVLLPFPTVVASSPGSLARGDNAIRKEFMPPIYLPVPSRSEVLELRALAFQDLSEDLVNLLMDFWGPNFRFCLVRVSDTEQEAQWTCVKQVPLDDIVV